jgi:hypothetical protein
MKSEEMLPLVQRTDSVRAAQRASNVALDDAIFLCLMDQSENATSLLVW